jgi:hypothetical protein
MDASCASEENLLQELCLMTDLSVAFTFVKRNKGKPGIDAVSFQDFEANLDEGLSQLQQELAG